MTSVAALLAAAAADASADVRGAIEASLIQLAAASADAVLAPAIELLGAASRPPAGAARVRAPRGDGDRAEGGRPRRRARRVAPRVRRQPAPRHAARRAGRGIFFELLLVLAERSDVEAAAVTHALLKHCEAGTLAAPCVLRALTRRRLRRAVGHRAAAEGGAAATAAANAGVGASSATVVFRFPASLALPPRRAHSVTRPLVCRRAPPPARTQHI